MLGFSPCIPDLPLGHEREPGAFGFVNGEEMTS